MARVIALCAALLGLAQLGCGFVQTKFPVELVPAGGASAAPARRQPGEVEIFVLNRPHRAYSPLGTLRTEGRDLDRLRRAAARRGCDALILQTPARFFRGCRGYEAFVVEALCVRYDG